MSWRPQVGQTWKKDGEVHLLLLERAPDSNYFHFTSLRLHDGSTWYVTILQSSSQLAWERVL